MGSVVAKNCTSNSIRKGRAASSLREFIQRDSPSTRIYVSMIRVEKMVHFAPPTDSRAIAKSTQSLTSPWTKCAGSSASFPPPVGSRKTPVRTRLETHGAPAAFAPLMSPLGLSVFGQKNIRFGRGERQDVLLGLTNSMAAVASAWCCALYPR